MRFKMKFLNPVICLIAGTVAGASFAASLETSADKTVQHSHDKSAKSGHGHHAGYVKPGAAVALTHDYDGQTAAGEFETITLTLSHMYETGTLRVEILPTDDLQVFSNIHAQSIRLHSGSNLNLPIQVSGTSTGTYSIAIETIYESDDGQEIRRVLSLPITIGPKAAGKTQPAAPYVQKATPDGVVALPAQEVIR